VDLPVHVSETAQDLGAAAAAYAASEMRALAQVHPLLSIVFATGTSQLETLRALTAIPGLPWDRVIGFHLDEYVGIGADHPASFRRYLRQELVERVPLRQFNPVEGDAADPEAFCDQYAELLRAHPPQLCLLGIGENGHLAFNDPPVANFNDPKDVKIVELDRECRQQQVNEGWFASLDEVPRRAMTLTISAVMRIPSLVVSVPGERKARIVERTLHEEISTRCPATILRTHLNTRLYVDRASLKVR
jgi:glucosamine-6-phosphate deaminase